MQGKCKYKECSVLLTPSHEFGIQYIMVMCEKYGIRGRIHSQKWDMEYVQTTESKRVFRCRALCNHWGVVYVHTMLHTYSVHQIQVTAKRVRPRFETRRGFEIQRENVELKNQIESRSSNILVRQTNNRVLQHLFVDNQIGFSLRGCVQLLEDSTNYSFTCQKTTY